MASQWLQNLCPERILRGELFQGGTGVWPCDFSWVMLKSQSVLHSSSLFRFFSSVFLYLKIFLLLCSVRHKLMFYFMCCRSYAGMLKKSQSRVGRVSTPLLVFHGLLVSTLWCSMHTLLLPTPDNTFFCQLPGGSVEHTLHSKDVLMRCLCPQPCCVSHWSFTHFSILRHLLFYFSSWTQDCYSLGVQYIFLSLGNALWVNPYTVNGLPHIWAPVWLARLPVIFSYKTSWYHLKRREKCIETMSEAWKTRYLPWNNHAHCSYSGVDTLHGSM